MPVHNADIVAIFDEIADLLAIEGANPFRIRAYRSAARTLSELGCNVQALVEQAGDLKALPGIGDDLATRIEEIVRTGSCTLLQHLRTEVPPAVAELLKIHGLGPKRVRALHHELGVRTVAELHEAARTGRICAIHRFGERKQQQILEATAAQLQGTRRVKLMAASAAAESLLARLRMTPGVVQAVAAGSLRRMRESVWDLDLLVSVKSDNKAVERFTHYEDVHEVQSSASTRASVVLKSGLQTNLRVVPPESFGAAWVYFTGSRAHNIALQRLARRSGLKINEHGVFRGARRVAGETEESVYRAMGLRWIEPELREDRGELEAARQKRRGPLFDATAGQAEMEQRANDRHTSGL